VAFHIQWRNRMTKLKLLSAALIAAATLATPAMARESGTPRGTWLWMPMRAPLPTRVILTAFLRSGSGRGRICHQPWDNAPPWRTRVGY